MLETEFNLLWELQYFLTFFVDPVVHDLVIDKPYVA